MNTKNPTNQKSNPLLDGLSPEPADVNYPGPDPCEPLDEFAGTKRARDKTRLIKWLTYHPQGASVVRTVKALFPVGAEKEISKREYTTTDYNFVRRFFDRTEYAELDADSDVLEASPTPPAFHLTLVSEIPSEERPGYAKDRAEALTYGLWDLNDVKDARRLAGDFVTYLNSIHDKRLMLQERHDPDKKLTMPYHTRFNDDHRKKEQWARYNTAWDAADEQYQKGVMVTLTTDPKRYDSIGDMTDGLMDAWQSLHETLNQKYGGDDRLDFIRALEFGGSEKSNHVGLPHLHVCIFGVPYVPKGWLNQYWSEKHAEVTHIHGMNKRGAESWTISTGDHSGKSAAGYLGKYLSKAFEAIGDDPDELRTEINCWRDDGTHAESELWKLALYWATGRQFWSSSHDLKEDRPDPDTLQQMPGLGETKLKRLADAGIRTLSDVRLTDTEVLAEIEGISKGFAETMKEIVGDVSHFDCFTFDFVGAAGWSAMPRSWASARHMGVSSIG